MGTRHPRWPHVAIWIHLLVVTLASWQLASPHSKTVYAFWAALSGLSLFVLTGLVHEASHRLLARSSWMNEIAGNLAGWLVLTPLTAYRAFHLKHHQTTNKEGDPNAPLNSRSMLLAGSVIYACLIHRYAWRNLRGRLFLRYLVELAAMTLLLTALVALLPRALRERAFFLPIGIVALLQNIRIVTEHLDLGSERYRDTWQLVLPGWLSRWLLHYDHHLEHHLRPGLHWHELPAYRAQLIARDPDLRLMRVSLVPYFRQVVFRFQPDPDLVAAAALPATSNGDESDRTARASRRRHRADAASTPEGRRESPEKRYHGLDALRGLTMVLVVVLHAALAYAVLPIPNLIWLVRDPTAHPAFDVLCWWTLGISSPFYLMSGFFAADLSQSRGLRAFMVNRCKRILGPFLVGGVVILPATFFIWLTGWLISGQCTTREFFRMKFHAKGFQRNLYGPGHLWSLEYLALMLAIYLIYEALRLSLSRKSTARGTSHAWLNRTLTSPWRPLLLALPTSLILWLGHQCIGLDAILDRSNSFVPEPFRLLHNLVFFGVGVSLHRLRHDLERLATLGWTYLVLSIPVFACRALLIQQDLARPLEGPAALALAASGALFIWLVTFGLLGLALGRLHRPRPAVSYLADSSYWVYLCHLPIIGLIQVNLYSLALPPLLKFTIVLGGTLAICLASYQVVVRHGILGRWLHGRRERPGPSPVSTRHPIGRFTAHTRIERFASRSEH